MGTVDERTTGTKQALPLAVGGGPPGLDALTPSHVGG